METKNSRVPIKEGNSKGNTNPPPKTPKPSIAPPPQSKPTANGGGANPSASAQGSTQKC